MSSREVERGPNESRTATPQAELESEVQRLRRQVAEMEARPPRGRRVREVASIVFVVLSVIAITLSAVAYWLRGTVLDTDSFMAAVQPGLESPEVDAALSARLTEETLQALALEERLQAALSDLGAALGEGLADALELAPAQQARIEALPLPQLEQLAGPIAGGLETRIAELTDRFVASEQFEDLLVQLTRTAHTKAVALAREDYEQLPNIVVESGEVRLDLLPVVARILADLLDQGLEFVGVGEIPFIDPADDPEASLVRLSDAVGLDLPPDFGQFTVMSQAQLTEVQDAVRLADRLVWVILLVTIALVALTLALAPDRRRGLVILSVGTAVGLVIGMLLIRNARDQIASVAATAQGRAGVAVLVDSTFDSLRGFMLLLLIVVLVVGLVAHLAARPAWAQRGFDAYRRVTAPKPGGSDLERFVTRYRDWLRVGAVALGVAVLAITGIGLVSVVLVVGFVGLALWWVTSVAARGSARAAEAPTGR
jgi:hypothetical protein